MSTGNKVIEVLEGQFGAKRQRDGSWRMNSPLRPGSDSQSFVVSIDPDGEHGKYFDHRDGKGGSLYELARQLGVSLPERTPVPDTLRSYTGLADYAAAHGLTAEELSAAGWKACQHQGRPALEYPTRTGPRWRYLDGRRPKYKSVKDYRPCWYGINERLRSWIDNGEQLVICNGEISVIAAQKNLIAAVTVPGGEHEIPGELIAELKGIYPEGRAIILAYDCDETGRTAAAANLQVLRNAGYKPRAVDLKLGSGGDLADFCMLYGEESLTALLSLPELPAQAQVAAPISSRSRREYIPADELYKLPRPQWLVEGIIPDNALTAIFGRAGEGKSFYALNIAREVAQGQRVLYVAAEGQSGYSQRIEAMKVHHKLTSLGDLTFCLGSVALVDRQDTAQFIDENRTNPPKLVIVDTLARTMVGGDENSTKDMGIYIDACDFIRQSLGCSVILVHHIGKNGATERGSSVLRASVDMMIKVQSEDDMFIVECSKTKDREPFPTQYFQLVSVPLSDGTGAVLVPTDRVLDDKPMTEKRKAILGILNMKVYSDGISPSDLRDLTGQTHGSVMRALEKFLEYDWVTKNKGIYQITDAGKEKLAEQDQPRSVPDRSQIGLRSISDRVVNRLSEPNSASTPKPDRSDRSDRSVLMHQSAQ